MLMNENPNPNPNPHPQEPLLPVTNEDSSLLVGPTASECDGSLDTSQLRAASVVRPLPPFMKEIYHLNPKSTLT